MRAGVVAAFESRNAATEISASPWVSLLPRLKLLVFSKVRFDVSHTHALDKRRVARAWYLLHASNAVAPQIGRKVTIGSSRVDVCATGVQVCPFVRTCISGIACKAGLL